MILGVTGLIGSGKGVTAEILKKKGFIHLSHSDVIIEEAKRRNIEINRENLVLIGNEMRSKYGRAVLTQQLIERIELGNNYIIEGFRNVAEVEACKKIKGFILIGIATGQKVRFERIKSRKREGDPQNYDSFILRESKDLGVNQEDYGQQNALCFSMADFYISNEDSLEEFEKSVELILKKQ